VPADVERIAACQVACWREAYAGLVPQAFLDAFDSPVRVERWRARVGVPGVVTVVAADEAGVVGFACVVEAPTDDPPLQLKSLYLRRTHHGTGVGDRLLAGALGSAGAWLWVFEANARARAFYRRHGFVPSGEHKIDEGTGVPELRLVRR